MPTKVEAAWSIQRDAGKKYRWILSFAFVVFKRNSKRNI
jgi:hypothetical protein